jgi:hypothetical protein
VILSAPPNVDWTEIRLECTKPTPLVKGARQAEPTGDLLDGKRSS